MEEKEISTLQMRSNTKEIVLKKETSLKIKS